MNRRRNLSLAFCSAVALTLASVVSVRAAAQTAQTTTATAG